MTDFYTLYDYEEPESTKEAISDEAHTIPSSAPYRIYLHHIPRQETPSSVGIAGYTEVFETAPDEGEFRVYYGISGAGCIEFNEADASDVIAVDYNACGTVVWAQLINQIQDLLEAIDSDLDGKVDSAESADSATNATKFGNNTLTQIQDMFYPVGSIYTNAIDDTNPGTLLGFGTWTAFGAGKVMVGLDSGDGDFNTAEETGGEKTHTLTVDEMPAHAHTIGYFQKMDWGSYNNTSQLTPGTNSSSGSAGGDSAHNNLQPYIVVYMWKRTA
jgi:hypothetical protein